MSVYSFLNRLARNQHQSTPDAEKMPQRESYVLESLESRLLLSADVFGIPFWSPEGPAPVTGGQTSSSPDDAVSGAVNALAAHPTNADILYAGGVDGGIWKTTNATSATPNWTPLTDQYTTLAISDLAFSPLDGTNNTLFAGTGGFTNGGPNGPAQGIIRTADGGASWQQFAQTTFNGLRIRSIVPTAIGTSLADQVVLAAAINTGGGVFRSTDGGETFTLVSGTSGSSDGLDNDADGAIDEVGELNLPLGQASYLIGDPGNANRFYAAIANQGVFRSDDGGVSWVDVTNNIAGAGAASNIELAVSPATGNPVYAGLVSGGVLQNVFRSSNQGGSWTAIGTAPAIHPGGQGFTNFSIIADASDANVVYVAGDRQAGPPYVGNMFRGDASSNSWTDVTDVLSTAFTAPHADSRDMVYDANGNILESDDGGIFRLTNPAGPLSLWTNLNRNLQVGQFYSAPYDHIRDVIFGGTQDIGSAVQSSPGSNTWTELNQGDGGTAGVGYFNDSGTDYSVEYTMGNNFGTFQRHFSAFPYTLADGQLGLSGLDATDSGFTGFTTFPYEVNRFNGARLVIGGINNLYESTDFGDNLNIITPAGVTGVSALAYGGSQGGVANPDVIYAGVGGNLYLRTTSGGAFTQLTSYTGGTPQDIALDPDDWMGVYVSDGSQVFHSTDGGSTWATVNSAGLGALTGTVRSLEVFSPSSTPGDEVLLAGGNSGVFRTLNPSAGGAALWTEFGAVLPNTPVVDINYDATDDILVASAFGRGLWSVADASDYLPVESVIVVDGDTDFPGQDDTITLIRDADVPSLLNVFLNNTVTPELTVPITAVMQINVNGLGSNDTLIVDSTNGLINVVNGIRYDGGSGFDELRLLQDGGTVQVSDTYSVGPLQGAGTSTIVGPGTDGTQMVYFENVEPVIDLVPAATLTVNATATGNAITYTQGSMAGRAMITIDEHESIEFANKTELEINAGAGQDTVAINNSTSPAGLDNITVDGGTPDSNDTLIVTGASQDVTVNTGTRLITGATGGLGSIDLNYVNVERLELAGGIADLELTTSVADDTVIVTPGDDSPLGANVGTVQSNGSGPEISFTNRGDFTANLFSGNDSLIVNASTAAETIAVSGTAVAISGRRQVNYSNVDALRVNGDDGEDTFNVTPSSTTAMFIDGGNPIGGVPGDSLVIDANGSSVTYNPGPETDEGSLGVGANQPVSFDHIETISITDAGPAVVNGTNAPDAISIIARDASTHAGADGVQDFTAAVNDGPELLFIDVASLTVNALGGSDQIALQTPAPNGAVWDVDLTVDGGLPAADTDRMIIETPGTVSAAYTPTGAHSGTFDLASLSSMATLDNIEMLNYDGHGDNDALTVLGSGADDTIVHMPGSDDQSGSIRVNGQLGLIYANLGASATLTVDGQGGPDTLVYTGTSADDSFTIGVAGEVSLNSHVVLNTTSIDTLTLEGFEGDDTFTLVPAISASVYTTINLNGGDEASATGDQVNLVATAGDDDIVVSGQTVSLGGKTVASSGIEDIRLNALGGDDLLTYNGVSGISENIVVSASAEVGGGQLNVEDVALVNFSGVERIDVNGNVPTPTETDTLSFAGTNADDTFDINLAADGTDGDPILRLQDSSATTLLTLRNYTNFETLNVLGLDGEDVFNVATDASGPSRNLFIEGGLPAGKKKSTDELHITYLNPRPSIIHSVETQNHDAGLVDLFYDPARYLIQYSGIEKVTIHKA